MFNKKTIYLDSASTSQTPRVVLRAMNDYYKHYRANVHRGLYKTSIQASDKFEEARRKIAKFINADWREIIFTSGTTHALNQLAFALTPRLSHHDNVVITRFEHHANLLPWQEMAKHYGFELRYIELDLSNLDQVIDANTKIVSFSLVSNVLGEIVPAERIIAAAKKVRATTIIDAAQAVAHFPIDVQKLDCDFLTFSGHKMYGPTGIGVLYGKRALLDEHLEPFFYGGDMVKSVNFYDPPEWNCLPYKFEAGTPNIAGAIGLGAAVDYINSIGFEKIRAHEQELVAYALAQLAPIAQIVIPAKAGIQTSGSPIKSGMTASDRIGLISFTVPGIHAHDIAYILAAENVAVRGGFHCAEPVHHLLGLEQGSTRMSFDVNTTKKDIDTAIRSIKKAIEIFKD